MIMPATWLIVSMWRGRNRRRKRLIRKASDVHQRTAPPRNPRITRNPRPRPAMSKVSIVEILKMAKKSQDVGNDQHEIGDRKAENRGEVLRKAGLAGPVAADLRYRVLKEDIDAYDDYEDAGDYAQQLVVLVDLGLKHRVAEIGDHRHRRIGGGYAEPRHDTRAAAFAEGPLDA